MIDLHTHILPGVDDGAASLDGSLEIARAAVEDGIEVVAATPHVRDDYPTRVDTMEQRLEEVRNAIDQAGIPLDVRPGAEIAVDRIRTLSADELRRFGLGGNPAYLLIEFPYYGWPLELAERLFELREAGVTPVLAHPERNSDVQARPEALRDLVDAGALVQLTAASVDGRFGRRVRETSLRLLGLGLGHLLATDAHAPDLRATGLSAAAATLEDAALAHWLTVAMPGAILRGEPLPARATPPPPRGWLERLRATF